MNTQLSLDLLKWRLVTGLLGLPHDESDAELPIAD
jgi:hypothetical protein